MLGGKRLSVTWKVYKYLSHVTQLSSISCWMFLILYVIWYDKILFYFFKRIDLLEMFERIYFILVLYLSRK